VLQSASNRHFLHKKCRKNLTQILSKSKGWTVGLVMVVVPRGKMVETYLAKSFYKKAFSKF